ncbi:MAG: hypothetical protein KME35_07850 [Aphanocapsa sp. GSE-SYN-MK-11-07L]|jgi:hypothetical protein|nr:hypothetical protein [Aphanocapsa sp. GSE-SYN-MK-11-07L]
MPKYSVGEVLDIIKNLTPAEKIDLKRQLENILHESGQVNVADAAPKQLQSFGNVSISGSSNNLDASQVGENANIAKGGTQAVSQDANLQEALNLLAQLQQLIANSNALNPIEKATFEVPVKTAAAELKKPNPDQSMIDQAIAALKKGFAGIEELAEPVARVALLVAKAWAVL